MGYTHYYRFRQPIDPSAWELICADMRKLIAAAPIPLVFDYDEPSRPPFLDDNVIRFNGVGEDGHETFYFERDMSRDAFAFCKTDRKPYDLVVCAAIAVINDHAGQAVRFSSDGNTEWKEPVRWASKTLGRVLAMPVLRAPA